MVLALGMPGVHIAGASPRSTLLTFQTTSVTPTTFDPTVTKATGDAVIWDFGDGTSREQNNAVSHTYESAGTKTVSLFVPDGNLSAITALDVRVDNITGDFLGAIAPLSGLTSLTFLFNTAITSSLSALTNFPNLESLSASNTTGISGDFGDFVPTCTGLTFIDLGQDSQLSVDLADLSPLSLTYLSLHNGVTISGGDLSTLASQGHPLTDLLMQTGNVTGSLSDLASIVTLEQIYLYHTAIDGSLSDLAPLTALTHLWVYDSDVSGGDISANVAMQDCRIYDLSWNQVTVDAFLLTLYNARATFTYATPALDISGTNAAPSGTYQYAASPSSGKEYIYALKNDDDGEGFNTWTITYTA